jgi:hypothetical protein
LENAEVLDPARTLWRSRAMDWLEAALEIWASWNLSAQRKAIREQLDRWNREPELKGLRDEPDIARLPEAERKRCRDLWARVVAPLQKPGG